MTPDEAWEYHKETIPMKRTPTPTQAQIKAARRRAKKHDRIIKDMRAKARAAAAAEVGEHDEIARLYRCIEAYRAELNRAREEIIALTTTAEAGKIDWTDIDAALAVAKEATIERCAQVAETFIQFTPCEKTFTAKAIAAAIRALKDQKSEEAKDQLYRDRLSIMMGNERPVR